MSTDTLDDSETSADSALEVTTMTVAADSSPSSDDENDYEEVEFRTKIQDGDRPAFQNPADDLANRSVASDAEEVVQSEPLYSLVTKTPKLIRAVDADVGQDAGTPEVPTEEVTVESVDQFADEVLREVERRTSMSEELSSEPANQVLEHVESDPIGEVDVKQELWDVKLPDPPTPFQDSLPAVSVGESDVKLDPGTGSDHKMQLDGGQELLEETRTEEVLVFQNDRYEAEHGMESTTDPVPVPVPVPVPRHDSDTESNDGTMRFSITTYHGRLEEEGISYEKKLSPSQSFNSNHGLNKPNLTVVPKPSLASISVSRAESFSGRSSTREPESLEPISSGTDCNLTNQAPPSLPFNLGFMEQFQQALHSISDPQVKALQEDFMRLQQQFISWQMQMINQQSGGSGVPVEPAKTSEEPPVQNPATAVPPVGRDQDETQPDDLQVPQRTPSPPPIDEEVQLNTKSIISVNMSSTVQEEPKYQYSGPPAVKLEPWKPGRPRSEILDFSRSSSFNVPEAIKAKEAFKRSETIAESPKAPEADTISIQVKMEDSAPNRAPGTESSASDVVESMTPSQALLRKTSFVTPRPFESRPASPKKSNFPSVIQPVPFVQRKIRSPEVRGFASATKEAKLELSPPLKPKIGPPVMKETKPRLGHSFSQDVPNVVIRSQLLQSARRPSAEFGSMPPLTDQGGKVEGEAVKEPECEPESPEKVSKLTVRPLSMPVSSSLLLAAKAAAKTEAAKPESSVAPPPPPMAPVATTVNGTVPGAAGGVEAVQKEVPKRVSLSAKFHTKVDPREELLNSIRKFSESGGSTLRKTGIKMV